MVLKYPVPVINQQGEIVGRLHVEIAKVSAGGMENKNMSGSQVSNSLYEEYEDEDDEVTPVEQRTITIKVTIRHLAGVTSSHYVFCQ